MAESGIGLWLRELSNWNGKILWLVGLGGLLAMRVLLSWRRDLERERLALRAGDAFHRRLWARGAVAGHDPSWLSREGREWIESGTRAALELRTALATLLFAVPLLIWLAPWISLAALVAIALVGRWAHERSRAWKLLSEKERDCAEEFARSEQWAWRSVPEAMPSGWVPVVARRRREVFSAYLAGRWERARAHLAWGTLGEAAAHLVGWLLGAAALLSWACGRLSAGSLMAFLGICLLSYRPVREAGRQLPHLRRAREVWDSLGENAPPPMSVSVSVEDLGAAWDHAPAVLVGMEFSVPPGALVAAHGPNGCGKSTLLSALAGAPLPLSGRILRPDRTFWMAQEPVLPPVSPASWTGIRRPFPEAVDGLLGLLFPGGIPESLDWNSPVPEGGHRLSRGQRARLCLLAAAARPLKLWLLDEPVSALAATEGAGLLRETLRRRGAAAAILAVPVLPAGLREVGRLWEPVGKGRGPVVSLLEAVS